MYIKDAFIHQKWFDFSTPLSLSQSFVSLLICKQSDSDYYLNLKSKFNFQSCSFQMWPTASYSLFWSRKEGIRKRRVLASYSSFREEITGKSNAHWAQFPNFYFVMHYFLGKCILERVHQSKCKLNFLSLSCAFGQKWKFEFDPFLKILADQKITQEIPFSGAFSRATKDLNWPRFEQCSQRRIPGRDRNLHPRIDKCPIRHSQRS